MNDWQREELLKKRIKELRQFKGNLKTKPIQRGAIITYGDTNGDDFIEKKAKLIDMYHSCDGGAYHTFGVEVDGKETGVDISRVIGYENPETPLFDDETYKHLTFHEQAVKDEVGKSIVYVYNKHDGDLLGEIRWFGLWKKYIFIPVIGEVKLSLQLPNSAQIAFHDGCLIKIADVCTVLKKRKSL